MAGRARGEGGHARNLVNARHPNLKLRRTRYVNHFGLSKLPAVLSTLCAGQSCYLNRPATPRSWPRRGKICLSAFTVDGHSFKKAAERNGTTARHISCISLQWSLIRRRFRIGELIGDIRAKCKWIAMQFWWIRCTPTVRNLIARLDSSRFA